MSVLTDIAKAVRDELNAASLSQTFEAEFTRLPDYDTAATSDLKVFVLGLTEADAAETRSDWKNAYGVTVAIYKRVDDDEELDNLDDFRQQVIDLLKSKNRLTSYAAAALISIAIDPVYDPATLAQKNTFVSVIALTYQTFSES